MSTKNSHDFAQVTDATDRIYPLAIHLKWVSQHHSVAMVFLNLKDAFHSVNRTAPVSHLRQKGVSQKFVNLLQTEILSAA